MKMPWLCVLVLLSGCTPSWAEDSYADMKSFIQQEDERLKDIKLLSLDLEKKQIQAKMAELSGTAAQDKAAGVLGKVTDGPPDIHVSGVIINDAVKQAFINMDGKMFPVREGQEIGDKMKVIKITSQFVSIQYADGKTHKLGLSGA